MINSAATNHKWVVVHIVVWALAKIMFLGIKLWGIEATPLQHINANAYLVFLMVALSGLVDGLVFGLIDLSLDKRFQSLTLTKRLIIKCLCNLSLGLLFTFSLIPALLGRTFRESMDILITNLAFEKVLLIAVYIFGITFLLQLFKLISQWVQVNNLSELISLHKEGVEEDRIFIFMDMKSSTSIAEMLSPEKFSFLIKDCFNDMKIAAEVSGAEIYQYVGDEAIFSWHTTDDNFRHAVYHFFCFRRSVERREDYYMDRYGIVPQFKAAIHHGKVIRTQVGVTKRSIAFIGDVLNTCSRIQGLCNHLNSELLVSESTATKLTELYELRSEGPFALRGKNEEVNLYSILTQ